MGINDAGKDSHGPVNAMRSNPMSQPPTTNEVATEIKKSDMDEAAKYLVKWSSAERWD